MNGRAVFSGTRIIGKKRTRRIFLARPDFEGFGLFV
jgi:hypothetical protein